MCQFDETHLKLSNETLVLLQILGTLFTLYNYKVTWVSESQPNANKMNKRKWKCMCLKRNLIPGMVRSVSVTLSSLSKIPVSKVEFCLGFQLAKWSFV